MDTTTRISGLSQFTPHGCCERSPIPPHLRDNIYLFLHSDDSGIVWTLTLTSFILVKATFQAPFSHWLTCALVRGTYSSLWARQPMGRWLTCLCAL